MRILFVTNVFPNPYQPLKGCFNLEMVRSLAEEHHQVDVICPVSWVEKRRPGAIAERPPVAPPGVTMHFPTYFYTPKVFRRFYASFFWWSVRNAVRRITEVRVPDIVLGYWIHPDAAVAMRVARTLGVPGVVMVGGSDLLVFTESPMRRRLIIQTLREADRIVTVSEHLKQRLVQFGIMDGNVTVVNRGVDTATFVRGDRTGSRRAVGFDDGVPLLLWVGRMVPVKGVPVLLDACRELRERRVAFRLALIGDGPARATLEQQVARDGLGAHVSFVGGVAHHLLPEWYRAADLVVLPSYSEGMPNVLLEAIACGTPFVATSVGGVGEVATPGVDEVVPAGDSGALALAIVEMLQRIPGAAPRRFEPIDRRAAACKVAQVLNTILEEHRNSTHSSVENLCVPLTGA